jgi:hypothetical protein
MAGTICELNGMRLVLDSYCTVLHPIVEDFLFYSTDRDEKGSTDYFLPAFLAATRARVICFFQP